MMPFQYISIRQKLCFPNKKIAIYDSGKLNMMMELLKKLKSESHKVIIFTQVPLKKGFCNKYQVIFLSRCQKCSIFSNSHSIPTISLMLDLMARPK